MDHPTAEHARSAEEAHGELAVWRPDSDPPRTPRAQLLGLFLIALVVYLSNARLVGQVDGRAAPRMAMSLLREGNLDLDEFTGHCLEGLAAQLPYVQKIDGHYYSKWSPAAAVVYLPFYAIPAWTGMQTTVPDDRNPAAVKENKAFRWVGKIAAATIAALTAIIVLLALRRLCPPAPAMLLAILYAFGMSAWPINAQDTWQHGPGALMLSLGLLGALCCRREGGRFGTTVAAALALGMATAVRPTNATLALPLGVLLLIRSPRRYWAAVIAAGLIAPLGLLAYNEWIFGAPLGGGYADAYEGSPWTTPLHLGAAGLLISPSRGLLLFTPATAFVIYGVWRAVRRPGSRLFTIALSAGCAAHLAIMGMWSGWFGGWAYGPRFLAEVMPLAVALIALGVDRVWSSIGWRSLLIVLVVISILIASLGCYVGVDDWHIRQEVVRRRPLGRAVWDWGECQILYQARKMLGLISKPPPAASRPAGAPAGS